MSVDEIVVSAQSLPHNDQLLLINALQQQWTVEQWELVRQLQAGPKIPI